MWSGKGGTAQIEVTSLCRSTTEASSESLCTHIPRYLKQVGMKYVVSICRCCNSSTDRHGVVIIGVNEYSLKGRSSASLAGTVRNELGLHSTQIDGRSKHKLPPLRPHNFDRRSSSTPRDTTAKASLPGYKSRRRELGDTRFGTDILSLFAGQ